MTMVGTSLTNGVDSGEFMAPTPAQGAPPADVEILSPIPAKAPPDLDPSPSSHCGGNSLKSPGTSDAENVIRIGDQYQAVIPPCFGLIDDETEHKATLMWSTDSQLSDKNIDEYLLVSRERFGYSSEQALGMLYWHRYNFDTALADLANYEPFHDDWTTEEKILFEQAISIHGKTFHNFRQILPQKPISTLVKYYYEWKKLRHKTSQVDRLTRKVLQEKLNCQEPETGPNDCNLGEVQAKTDAPHSIGEHAVDIGDNEGESLRSCDNCGNETVFHSPSPIPDFKGLLCIICIRHWRITGERRVVLAKDRRPCHVSRSPQRPHQRSGPKEPPPGMMLSQEDVRFLTAESPSKVEAAFGQLDKDVVSLKRQIQKNKQVTSIKKTKLEQIEDLDAEELYLGTRINNRWSNEELLMAVQGFKSYGLDFKAIAEILGNKTEAHIKSFFNNYKRRYNLESVLEDHKKAKQEKAVDKGEIAPNLNDAIKVVSELVQPTGNSPFKSILSQTVSTNQTQSASISPSVVAVEPSSRGLSNDSPANLPCNQLSPPATSSQSLNPMSANLPNTRNPSNRSDYHNHSNSLKHPNIDNSNDLNNHLSPQKHRPNSPDHSSPPNLSIHSKRHNFLNPSNISITSSLSNPPVRPNNDLLNHPNPPNLSFPVNTPILSYPSLTHREPRTKEINHLSNRQPIVSVSAASHDSADSVKAPSKPPPPTGSQRNNNNNNNNPTPHHAMPQLISLHPPAGLQVVARSTRSPPFSTSSSSMTATSTQSPPVLHHHHHQLHPPFPLHTLAGQQPNQVPIPPAHSSISRPLPHHPQAGLHHPMTSHHNHLAAAAGFHSSPLIRPHPPPIGPGYPHAPIAALPIGASHIIARQTPASQNNLVRPGIPLLYKSHPAIPVTRGS